jgi:3-hydroxyisobutyrate dehydrogenase
MHTIGFVGLGAMGAAMARQLVAKQFRVVGYDINEAAADALAAAGGHKAGSVRQAANGADALVVMVVNADQAEQVLFGDGAVEALADGAPVIVCSTCAPDRAAAMAERCEVAGHPFIDAPVSGGVVGAEAGTLTIMAAAKKPDFAATGDLLRAMGSNLYHIGETAGQGSAMKTVNQLMAGVHIVVAAEAMAFAERAGIDPELALEILSGSAASSWMLKDRGERMIGKSDAVTSAVDIFVKDLGIVLDAGRAMRMGLPLAAAAHQQYLDVSGAGDGKADDSQVIRAYRKTKKTGA